MSTSPVKNNVPERNKQSLQGQAPTTAPLYSRLGKFPTETSKQLGRSPRNTLSYFKMKNKSALGL